MVELSRAIVSARNARGMSVTQVPSRVRGLGMLSNDCAPTEAISSGTVSAASQQDRRRSEPSDGDLFFEKTGISREMAFRLAYRSDIEFAFTPRAYKHELRRLHGRLAHPRDVFGVKEPAFEEIPIRR